jgi:hypothetical protein
MTIKPLAYINVEERKLEWAEPITWHTPTIAQMEKIPLYTHPAKTLTEIIEKNKPEIEKANAYIKLLEDEIKALKAKTEDEALKTFYEDRLEAGKRREETLLKTIEALLRKAQEK